MAEIKENDAKMSDLVDKHIPSVMAQLEKSGIYESYSYSNGIPYDVAKALAKKFVAKGYYAKINHFTNRNKYQCVMISKRPLHESNGRLVWTEFIR